MNEKKTNQDRWSCKSLVRMHFSEYRPGNLAIFGTLLKKMTVLSRGSFRECGRNRSAPLDFDEQAPFPMHEPPPPFKEQGPW